MKFNQSEKAITTTHDDLGELKLEKFETPAVESLQEAIQFAGGEEGLLEYLNGAFEGDSKIAGRTALKSASKTDNLETVYERARRATRDWSPLSMGRGVANQIARKKAAALDEIAALMASGNASQEAILELLQKAK